MAKEHEEELEDLITELSAGEKNPKRRIAWYQPALKQLCQRYEENRAHYEQIAAVWNREGLPPEEQRKRFLRNGSHCVQEFAKFVYKAFGMRVFILGSVKLEDGKVGLVE